MNPVRLSWVLIILEDFMSYTIYFAGDLFDHKHLAGNASLATAIAEKSEGRFLCKLPQNYESHTMTALEIRDNDLRLLIGCDLALFNFDGTELDSGTVVEYMYAKFADMPSVILRTDIRNASAGHDENPWNPMVSNYPRTEVVVLNVHERYQSLAPSSQNSEADLLRHYKENGSCKSAAATTDWVAGEVVVALERVLEQPARLPPNQVSTVYDWLARMPEFGEAAGDLAYFEKVLEAKRRKGLI